MTSPGGAESMESRDAGHEREGVERGPAPSGDASHSFLRLALRPDIVRRACGYAVVVGAILIAINHGDALIAGEVTTNRILKMLLTVAVPYCVSTASAVGAIRERSG